MGFSPQFISVLMAKAQNENTIYTSLKAGDSQKVTDFIRHQFFKIKKYVLNILNPFILKFNKNTCF